MHAHARASQQALLGSGDTNTSKSSGAHFTPCSPWAPTSHRALPVPVCLVLLAGGLGGVGPGLLRASPRAPHWAEADF